MSHTLVEKDNKYIWHPFTPLAEGYEPLFISRAKGCYLYTENNRALLDGISSWWVNIHGHSHPYIAEKLYEQAKKLEHVIFAGFTHEPAIRLAERVLDILPSNQTKFFYSDNGSTAVEVGVKMAIQYFYNQGIKKTKVIAFKGAYHGDTFGGMSLGERGIFNSAYSKQLFDVEFVDLPNDDNFAEVEQQFLALIETGNIAAFVFEPLVQGAGGMRMYKASHLNSLMKLAQNQDVICIADEVMTGFGRTGKHFACQYLESTQPDIMCLSKGLTGGTMALGATSCSAKIVDAFRSDDIRKTFFHSHSYTANPLACAVANASLDLYLDPSCQANIQRISKQHKEFLETYKQHSAFRDVRTQGTILAMELQTEGKTSYFNQDRNRIYNYFLNKNILLRPLGNVIYVLPPYVITNDELQKIYQAIESFISQKD